MKRLSLVLIFLCSVAGSLFGMDGNSSVIIRNIATPVVYRYIVVNPDGTLAEPDKKRGVVLQEGITIDINIELKKIGTEYQTLRIISKKTPAIQDDLTKATVLFSYQPTGNTKKLNIILCEGALLKYEAAD